MRRSDPAAWVAPWVATQPHLSLPAWQVRLFSHLSQYEREGSLTAAAVAKGAGQQIIFRTRRSFLRSSCSSRDFTALLL